MNNQKTLATRIVDEMFDKDKFSQWLGIERLVIEKGHCVLRMKVRPEMINGFGIRSEERRVGKEC